MGHKSSKRRGNIWNDAIHLNELILDFPFATTGGKEKDFERGIATSLMVSKKSFKNPVITQIDKSTSVESVYCFGKAHRPDMTIGKDGVAIEFKFINYNGLKDAIGQAYLYRIHYRFVFLVLVINESRKDMYLDIAQGKEMPLNAVLESLASQHNIFTYIVPSFPIKKPGINKCVSFFR